ncbi:hypothetical protein CHLRE_16g660850v5 [Chlamydomonas reinhardtii]|uniref:Uncharacterized protein n=1 Tax=Chlamydomonas reinhardtii TaxID=3055 RepID=A0A2K3CTJ1_CHLRE|nr:uncharacterized protein CHLRE_16g660850v5 [Chlamydomonas reinhardtii]PNW71596.1 hypothetical protein CHLRE_16g660850v5 [Chlamydomonas reinhardtii]
MGKNQGHKQTQRSRYTGGDGGGTGDYNDGMKDVSFHTAEWHAARIANLTVERIGWEEWRSKQKEAEGKLAAAAEEEERKMRDYRAQLDADRKKLLARGRNHEDLAKEIKDEKKRKRKEKKSKKESKDKDKKSKKSKKSKKRRRSDSGSSSSDSSSDSDSEGKGGEGEPGGEEDPNKPMRLSDWLKM